MAKRLIDIVLSVGVLLMSLPLIALIALLIKIESRGPLLYRAQRVGRYGRDLEVLKFRKMRVGASDLPLTVAHDERFTRVGAVLAKTKLDELPQMWNVIRGDMSLVGPRPEDPEFVRLHAAAYDEILRLRPGVTGWTQLVFAHERELLDCPDPMRRYVDELLPQKVLIDQAYVRSHRCVNDLRVIILTPFVLTGSVVAAVNEDGSEVRFSRVR